MIQTPNKGAPITAVWARKVTDAANAYNENSMKRLVIAQGLKLDSASEHAFKFKLFEQASEGEQPKFSICLPPNSVMWGETPLDAKGAMKEAKIKKPQTGNSQDDKVNVDGRFSHCYVFEAAAGEWKQETKKIDEKSVTIYKGEVYGAILDKGGTPAVSFLIAKDSSDLDTQKNKIEAGGQILAMFCVARLDANGIEQISKGAMNYGGGSGGGGDAVLCKITGEAQGGYSVNVYGNGRNSTATGTGYLYLTEIALGAKLPNGAWVLGHPTKMELTGGNDYD